MLLDHWFLIHNGGSSLRAIEETVDVAIPVLLVLPVRQAGPAELMAALRAGHVQAAAAMHDGPLAARAALGAALPQEVLLLLQLALAVRELVPSAGVA